MGLELGVSPLFYLRKFGEDFLLSDMVASLSQAAALGFRGFQPEIYRASSLDSWTARAATGLGESLRSSGLRATAFVAHFAMADFANEGSLAFPLHEEDFSRAAAIAAGFEGLDCLVLPLPPFSGGSGARLASSRVFVDVLGRRLETARAFGLRLAVESLPGSLAGGSADFVSLRAQAGLESLGYLLDTGHARARGEELADLPGLLGEALLATHIGDSRGGTKLPLGAGELDFTAFARALLDSGYRGGLDLEIPGKPETLETDYASGRALLLGALESARRGEGWIRGTAV